MRENNSRKLSVGLKFVQWQVNISHHETTGHSPFKVTFGQDTQVGLGPSILPSTALCNIFTEEDLEAETEVEVETGPIRVSATLGQSKTATRMTRCGKYLLKPLSVGQCATLRVPDVDRGPTDPRNLLVVVLKENDGLHTVGCREEIIGPKFTATDLCAIKQPLIKPEEVPDICLSIRTATVRGTGGQGYVKCQCTTQCTSQWCSCLRKKLKCNSRCHPGRSCKNL
ncbi:uncharacterized protein LOC143034113 [Oratosquilla oratoria]|uniref:uncharacterized protein LOC143034113 n=1 Tax=Oratosquilla oratoria TaxID=337810 RepID=UPI003F766E46